MTEQADQKWSEKNWSRFVRNAIDADDRAGLQSQLTGLRALSGDAGQEPPISPRTGFRLSGRATAAIPAIFSPNGAPR